MPSWTIGHRLARLDRPGLTPDAIDSLGLGKQSLESAKTGWAGVEDSCPGFHRQAHGSAPGVGAMYVETSVSAGPTATGSVALPMAGVMRWLKERKR